MCKMLLVLIPICVLIPFMIALLFIIVPDFWIDSLKDNNLLKRLMNNDYFKIIYVIGAVVIITMIILCLIHLGGFLLEIPLS